MKRILTSISIFHLLLVFICTFPALSEEQTKPDFSEAIRLIDTWLEAQRDYDHLPGISVAIVTDQEILWSKGYGMADLEKKAPSSPDTIYSICSISKLFTSVAIMQLRDAGKLRLEDLVSDHLPWFNLKQQYPDTGPITIRSLLTHSSGLPRESDYPYWSGPDFPFPSSEQVKAKLGTQKTLYPPSTYHQYSNLGLTLLGEIVAEVSGVPYPQYIQQNILIPLQLADTLPELPESLWRGKLAIFGLPSENPAQDIELLKHIEGDTFRRLRKDETLGAEVVFERDETGKVVRFWEHSNFQNKIHRNND